LAAGTAVLALAVGAALVWCGYHWPLDVVGSWLLAVALLSPVAAARLVPGAVPGRPGKQPREVRSSSGSPG
jgi:undecaprenyl-diphosphatase